jgi:phage head maturation protease
MTSTQIAPAAPISLPDLIAVRTVLLPVRLRAGDGGDLASAEGNLGLLDVRFSPFDTWYRISSFWEGDFMERTMPGAFKRTINAHNAAQGEDAHRIRSMFNHGTDMQIDQKLLGDVVRAAEEKDSPIITVDLWDTSYNRDLLPGLRSGAYGASFMFQTVRDSWNYEPEPSDQNPDGVPERTLEEVKTFEAGPVTWPASPTASAGMRCHSATDAYYEALARRDPSRVDGMRSRLTALRSAAPVHPDTAAPSGLAQPSQTDSASRHSGSISPRQRREAIYPYLRKGE